MYRLSDFGWMLADRARLDAWHAALALVVRPDSVVADLGSGIGAFALLAARLGAARVYAIEPDPILALGQALALENRLDGIEFLKATGVEVTLPERATVLVSDLAGALPLFKRHIPSVIDARDRLLALGGVLMPSQDRLLCAPLSSESFYERINAPWHALPGVECGSLRTMALQSAFPLAVTPEQLAGAPRCWSVLDYPTIQSADVAGNITWSFDRESTIHGVAVWFERTLHGTISYSSGPWSPGSVHATIVLPLLTPLHVAAGAELHVSLRALLVGEDYVWTWSANTPGHEPTLHSTFFGQPFKLGASYDSGTERVLHRPTGLVKRAEHILDRVDDGSRLLLNLRTKALQRLNETGSRIWDLLATETDCVQIGQALASEFDVEVKTATDDASTLVAELIGTGFVEEA